MPAQITRRKQFEMYPMDELEAIEQLELLGHDFFLYVNPDNGNVNMIYRRKDGKLWHYRADNGIDEAIQY